MKKFVIAAALVTVFAGSASASESGLKIMDNAIAASAEGGAAAASGHGIAVNVGSVDISSVTTSTTIDKSISQSAIMKEEVSFRPDISIRGEGNLNTKAGNGNGSIGGGMNLSAVGAANSISTVVTGATGGHRPN